MKQISFEGKAFEDFTNWATQDKKVYIKIITLIKDINRNSFIGLGKPEAPDLTPKHHKDKIHNNYKSPF